MNKEIKDVFFDLDHTLWDFDRNSGLAFSKIFEKNSININLEAFLEVYSPINFQYWKWYREERVTKAQLRYGRFKKTFDALRIKVTDDTIDKLSEDYIIHLPDHNYLFDGTIELLDYLKQHYKLHIITNGFEEVQLKKLKNSNIDMYFDTVTTSEAVGVKKPNPRIFKVALQGANAIPEESMMIGDTYEADILGAEGMNMKTICYNYHDLKMPDKQVVVNHLLEIRNYL
ncbi:noncanonical pyrimidine nucleotidase, YjjG family protein [Dokdonia pacifica]|uniref:Putative hydrolase of the HAD superfamily n=1 Tax=Dokdonia pacifica TaxID=1627892 RepID=A0A239CEL7_9FLAO|nr:YjjG family noncanonical pyrimidine nucleotidase [Dokdonia pacifica]GGG25486.1 noncanonical pyrimidine nucleotidase, YjjG family protein [Dokdonia pacifica]SNS18409.1 putative hydrolase of the HAD superfamily [Dokdonia pacifica]